MATRSRPWRALLLLALPLALIALEPWLHLRARLGEWAHWAQGLGTSGSAAFVLLYVSVTVAGGPSGPLVIAGGLLFGPVYGLLLVTAAGMLSAGLAYWLARGFAGEETRRWLEHQPWWPPLQPRLARHAGPIVALMRMLPGLPFAMQNYVLGLSGVPFGTYLAWTAVGIVPLGVITVVGTEAVVRSLRQGYLALDLIVVFLGLVLLLAGLLARGRRYLDRK